MAMAISSSSLPCSLLMAALMLLAFITEVHGITRHYDFNPRASPAC
ncbi:hypothetical protein HU200_026083 [Digitaria exilis]|uniref:Uncharacterized protein n=1 Tax=Digitaria exilis TaxID=1010633 RepID=A0A835EUT4_9POAL|nr:hypothetical protein HU200_026083 [Digitaria exilis]